jgi:hypothetical protein
MLEDDEYCANQLQKMRDSDVSFDVLWEKKLYSSVSNILNKLI